MDHSTRQIHRVTLCVMGHLMSDWVELSAIKWQKFLLPDSDQLIAYCQYSPSIHFFAGLIVLQTQHKDQNFAAL